jgi:hypothetical protein
VELGVALGVDEGDGVELGVCDGVELTVDDGVEEGDGVEDGVCEIVLDGV